VADVNAEVVGLAQLQNNASNNAVKNIGFGLNSRQGDQGPML
jgi:hypothetical protein